MPIPSVRAEKKEKKKTSKFIFGFLVITQSQDLGFGRNLVEIDPRSLPELFQQLGDQNKGQKQKKNEIIGGVHDLQILSWEHVIEFSQDPPGSLPVDSIRPL